LREITKHHDGHGLNESIRVESDERDPNAGNGTHHYQAFVGGHDQKVMDIQFQHGADVHRSPIIRTPRTATGSAREPGEQGMPASTVDTHRAACGP
jgi:hypothetical protein